MTNAILPCQLAAFIECLLLKDTMIGTAGNCKVNRRHGFYPCFRHRNKEKKKKKTALECSKWENKLIGPLKSMSK